MLPRDHRGGHRQPDRGDCAFARDRAWRSRRKSGLAGNTPAIRLSPSSPGPHPMALLAHGATASKETLFRFGEALSAAGFDCFTVDLPGHGASRQSFSIRKVLHTPGEVARALESVDVFLGHSMGAAVGAWSVREAGFRPKLFIGVGAIKTYTVGAQSAEGMKFSATEMPIIPGKTPPDFDQIPQTFARDGQQVSDVVKAPFSGWPSISLSVVGPRSGAYMRYVRTSGSVITVILEYPAAHRSEAALFKSRFLDSLKIKTPKSAAAGNGATASLFQ